MDSYVDGTLWQQLTNVPPTTKIRIMTMQMKGDFALEGRKFAAQHGNTIPSINPAAVETITGRGDFSVFAGMMNGLLPNWSHPWEQPLDIAQLDATIQDTPDNPLQTPFQTDITTYGKRFMARVAHLVFNALQLMLARPELVSMGSLVKQVHNRKSTPSKRFGLPT